MDVSGAGAGAGSDGEKKKPPEGGEVSSNKSKRKMKTAAQLEVLEKTYAVETYPSEELRAELSAQLGLTDRQLQMWFCHRRLKDRKGGPAAKRQQKDESPAQSALPGGEEMTVAGESRNELLTMPVAGSSPFAHGMDARSVVTRTPGVAVARISSEMSTMKRYYEPQQSVVELRAITFIEAQLGEPLREDGPILGMEFDPLPPDAFGAPIGAATGGQQKQPSRPFEANLYEPPDGKTIKSTTRPVHEYQFLPQQPSVRTDAYERVTQNYPYGSPADSHNGKTTTLSTARPFMHANEPVSSGYGFPTLLPSLNLMPQEGRQSHLLPSTTAEYDNVLRKSSLTNIGVDAHPITTLENPFMQYDRRVAPDEDVLRIQKKRKSEEARMAREVEAQEKRFRKELEKQDILRRKREEQIRKEMERHDRERRKEEERLLREKQREEERYQREQRRELERRERFLQKESIRAEKMRQKEELRREKEAARQKAATKRAIARRIAKESLELVDDERLELMELAATSKGLSSVVCLDFETLQNLDLFRDKLAVFPPKSVPLKQPFSVQPWSDSEENVGNLLMVWRFLITFADVLGMWPFTLDEFVQAFHDFDSRLLNEIHVALLRTIIKDIEDVARTPATGLGASQNSAANPGGGHPQIVEGAYAWGFDIRSWQRHLNPLTWPEILRQFALSTGFGPRLKKRNDEQAYHRDDNEGKDGEDVITNLRNGAAVENAVAIMQERGFSNPRRSRHRLTPGTVKFAAFHILSLEGNKGLTILDVAEKIQKSGLRDLSTSKTPEASIAAALSRDSKLFERTAPSTYCVRPAYRKDPTDAEAILSAARERIRIFKSGFVDGDDADDAERDEDSESDVADDPDVEDLGTDLNLMAEAHNSPDSKKFSEETPFENGNKGGDVIRTLQVQPENDSKGLPSLHSESISEVKDISASINQSVDVLNIKEEEADIDESNLGEPWVQGLMEGEYSDLSVEERLHALAALIGVAIEGNSIRLILEERLEAANALKKQMWAEAQLDKRRMKEEYVLKMHYSSFAGNKVEPNIVASTPETRQSPLVTINEKINEMSVNTGAQQQSNDPQNDINYPNNIPSEENLQSQDLSAGPDNLLFLQPGVIADKSRSQLKSFIGHKAEEMYVYRSLPLGQDRRRNRYWQFTASNSCNDPGCGRIFVELHDGHWRLVDSEEGFDSLLMSLDVRGVRESHLHMMLQKVEMSFKEAVRRKMSSASMGRQSQHTVKAEATNGPDCGPGTDSPSSGICILDSDVSETSTSFAVELGRNESECSLALRRYQDLEKWMWKECFSSLILCAMKYGKKRSRQLVGVCDCCRDTYLLEDDHCPCQRMHEFSNSGLSISKHVRCEDNPGAGLNYSSHASSSPPRIRLLKMQLSLIEVSLLQEALQHVWTNGYRKSWGKKLQSSFSAEDLLQILTLLEGSIKRDFLSSNFETSSELLRPNHPSECASFDSSQIENVPLPPWVPRTTAAVALRIMELDSSVSYTLHQKVERQKDKGNGDSIKVPSKFATQDGEATQIPQKAGLFQEDNCMDVETGSAKLVHGRGSRVRGRNRTNGTSSQRRAAGSRTESGRRSASTSKNRSRQVLSWKRQSRPQGGRKQGRRSARSRQKPATRVDVAAPADTAKETLYERVPTSLGRVDWSVDETRFQLGAAENLSSSDRSEYDGDEYDDLAPNGITGGFEEEKSFKTDDLLEGSDYNMDPNEEEEDEEADFDDQGDLDAEGYIDEDSDEEDVGIEDGDGGQNGDPDEGTESSSSDFSE